MVPVARRNLFQEKIRLLISVGGVAFALLLVLGIEGLVDGSMQRITAYIERNGAQVYLAQAGVRTMHMSASALPLGMVDQVSAVPGVAHAVPILYAANAALVSGDSRVGVYVVGVDTKAGLGGPWSMEGGSSLLGRGEAIIDRVAAKKLGVSLGDEVAVLGSRFRVRGLAAGTASLVSSLVFVRFDDFATLRGLSDTASYILADMGPGLTPEEGAGRIRAAVAGAEVLTRPEFAREEGGLVRDMSAQILYIMGAVGFSIGLAAVALTIYTATLVKLPEYGVLKALGARGGWLYKLVIGQALWSVGLGAASAVALAYGLGALLGVVKPDVPLVVLPGSILRMLVGAAVIALLAAVLPILQIARLDPAAVFRR